MRGARVFVAREHFPKTEDGEFYWVDLMGLNVVNREGVALGVIKDLMATGPQTVLVTSVERPERAPGTLEMLAADATGAWLVTTPHLPFKANGSGDVTAALFTAHYRSSGSAATALARTTASVFELLQMTLQSGARELQLVQAQEAYVHPRQTFEVRQVR